MGGSKFYGGGDTLQGVAAALWGDAALWYKLAEANGLSADAMLVAGQSLSVPVGVIKNSNSASTFNPYDTARATGDLSPTTNKPPRKNKCGAFGQIMLIAVAIAVTAVIAGPASAAITSALQGTAAAGTAAATAASVAGGALGGAIAGAAGSIASQAVGVASGMQSSFSWKGVALAAITGGVNGGIAGLSNAVPAALEAGQSLTAFGKFAQSVGGNGVLMSAARGAFSSAASQGIGVVTGLQNKFDWAGVAAAGVTSGVSAAIGVKPISRNNRSLNAYLSNTGVGMANAIANAATRSLINGSSFGDNVLAALPDVIGQTIGGMIADGLASAGSQSGASAAAGAPEATVEPISAEGHANGAILAELAEGQVRWDELMGHIDLLTLQVAGGDVQLARRMIMESYGPTQEALASRNGGASSTADLSNVHITNVDDSGRVHDGSAVYGPEHWNEGMRSFGGNYRQSDGTYTWVENKEIMARVNADLARFDRQVALAVFGPPLIAAGGVLAPAAGAYVVSLGGTSISGTTAAAAYYGTSFTVGGAFGATFEYAKNEALDLPHTPGGYAGAVLGGGFGGTGWQVLGSRAPVLLNNIATGGFLGVVGDGSGQFIDTKLGYRSDYDFRSMMVSGGIGAGAGSAVPLVRLNGLNAGRNNSLSIYNGLQTRINTGNVGQFRLRYGVMGGLGQGVGGVGQTAAGSVYMSIYQDANR